MHLEVAVERGLTDATGLPANRIELAGQLDDRLVDARRDGGELPHVGGDQRGIGLRDEAVRQVEWARDRRHGR